jgi:hypothetical protein
MGNTCTVLAGNFMGRDRLGVIGVNERIILKWMLQ